MRKLREEIRNDPERHEEAKRKERERYHQRKKDGKIKSIKDMNNRDQRNIRKCWRERSKKCYENKKRNEKLENLVPPQSPQLQDQLTPRSSTGNSTRRSIRCSAGKKIRRRNRDQLKREIERLQAKLKSEQARTNKYKKRLHRIKEKRDPTPRKRTEDLL